MGGVKHECPAAAPKYLDDLPRARAAVEVEGRPAELDDGAVPSRRSERVETQSIDEPILVRSLIMFLKYICQLLPGGLAGLGVVIPYAGEERDVQTHIACRGWAHRNSLPDAWLAVLGWPSLSA